MQKIMVISDTHDDHDAIRGVMRYLKTFKVDQIIHLGDYYDDADILEQAGYPLTRVPGTWDTVYYPGSDVSNRKFIEIAGWRIFLTHTPESHYNDRVDDIRPESVIQNGDTDIFLFGHTHIAEIRRRNGTVCINPGHMSNDESRGCPLTFALLEIDPEQMTVGIFQLPDIHPRIQKKYRKSDLK
jgi:putative phosphoesterase